MENNRGSNHRAEKRHSGRGCSSIVFQFHSLKLSRESCFVLFFNYTGLYKERSTNYVYGGVHAFLVLEPTECSTSTKQGA